MGCHFDKGKSNYASNKEVVQVIEISFFAEPVRQLKEAVELFGFVLVVKEKFRPAKVQPQSAR
jgi:hypothetical protein